jgi:predicted dehydrogenase
MEMNPVKWGVIGVAKIAVDKVIPAMQASPWSTVTAIASRSLDKAEEAARRLNIARVYGSYEDLLADPDIEAIYNPLPNHLHVPYTIQAAQAGKHVLCEKPLGMNAEEARDLLRVCRQTGVKIGEAFMVRTHPQWLRTRELVQSGAIGTLRAVQGTFSFFNVESDNIRNIAEYGGGGLLDIGCYPITTSRFVCGREPERVFGRLDFDDRFKTDRLGSIILDFGDFLGSFVFSTQMVHYQRMHFFGTEARVEIEIPFNAPSDRPCRLFIGRGDRYGADIETVEFPIVDQYRIQGDHFSEAIRTDTEPAVTVDDSVRNMAVIDAVARSNQSGHWEAPE